MENKCPYCGGVVGVDRARLSSGIVGYLGFCAHNCIAVSGTVCDTEESAIHAFCHPAHLLKDKVLVKRGVVEDIIDLICGKCFYGGACNRECEVKRLQAALDAAEEDDDAENQD